MMTTYASIPYFGQCVEYVTQVLPDASGFCDVKINTVPISQIDLTTSQNVKAFFDNFVTVLQLKSRTTDLTGADYQVAIPASIRLLLNTWLVANGFVMANVTSTYAQILTAMRTKLQS